MAVLKYKDPVTNEWKPVSTGGSSGGAGVPITSNPSDDTTVWIDPNENLQMINTSNQIGDIKITTRTDLGDSWILCNGDTVDAFENPNHRNILNMSNTNTEFSIQNTENILHKLGYSTGNIASSIYCHGAWFISYRTSSSVHNIFTNFILYDNGEVKTLDIGSSSRINRVEYSDLYNTYIICGRPYSSASYISYNIYSYNNNVLTKLGEVTRINDDYLSMLQKDDYTGEIYFVYLYGSDDNIYFIHCDLTNNTLVQYTSTCKLSTLCPNIVIYDKKVYITKSSGSSGANTLYIFMLDSTQTTYVSGQCKDTEYGNYYTSRGCLYLNNYIYTSGIRIPAGSTNISLIEQVSDTPIFEILYKYNNYIYGFYVGMSTTDRVRVERYSLNAEGFLDVNVQFLAENLCQGRSFSSTNSISSIRHNTIRVTSDFDDKMKFEIQFISDDGILTTSRQTCAYPTISMDGSYAYIKVEE